MDFLIFWLSSVPAFAAPFALGVLGMIICEKSGVLNLGTEGFLLVGAMSGAGFLIIFGENAFLALLFSGLSGLLFGGLFAILVAVLRINQVISGLIMVFLGQGLTALIGKNLGLINKSFTGLEALNIEGLRNVFLLGPILFNQDAFIYALVLIFFIFSYLLNKTRIGLHLRAVGENPDAADAAGIDVILVRCGAILVSSFLIGLAGGYLTVGVAKIWVDGISGGRGWIIIALVIFSRWRLDRAAYGAVLFGCIEALIPRLAASGVQLPQYFVLMLPYVATIAVMVWSSFSERRDLSPKALGTPYSREERT